MHNEAVRNKPSMIYFVPDQYRTQEMCNDAVRTEPHSLEYVPDHLKTQKMCNKSVSLDPYLFFKVPDKFLMVEMCERAVIYAHWCIKDVFDRLKMAEMCNEAVRREPCMLGHVPDHFKNQGMCEKSVKKDPWSLKYVPDWSVTLEQLKIWHDDNKYCDDDRLIEWHKRYQKRKAIVLTSWVQVRSSIVGNSAPAVDAQNVFKSTFKELINEDSSIGSDTERYQGVLEHASSKVDFSIGIGERLRDTITKF